MDWSYTWTTALYYGDDTGDEGKGSALRVSKTLQGATLRQIIRSSTGGKFLRLTFSNEYGKSPMVLKAVRVAAATALTRSDIDISTDSAVTFCGGSEEISIPAGARAVSDAVRFDLAPLQRLAVSVYFGQIPERVACHVGARANSFIVPGNAVSAENITGTGATVNTHWFALGSAEVMSDAQDTQDAQDIRNAQTIRKPGSIIAFGDSITDGYGISDEQYTRWTDILAQKLQDDPQTRHLGVANMGIGTNHLLKQKNPMAAIKRFERDVLSRDGAGYLIFLIGINDLAFTGTTAEQMIEAYKKIISKARAKGIKVFPATLLPYSKTDPRRHEINDWLRAETCEAELIDFDALICDPKAPEHMRDEFKNDDIHPNAVAYAAMGDLAYKKISGLFFAL